MVDLANAGTGALTGAGIGSAFGPIGAGIGGALGGAAGLFGFGKAKQPKIKQMQNFDPQQQAVINQLSEAAQQGNQQAFEWLNRILSGDESAFAEFEAPAMEQFQQSTVPSILERFSYGQQGNMSKGNSALNNSLGAAAKSLSLGLSAQRAGLKGDAINALQNYTSQALTKKTTPYIKGGQAGGWEGLGGAAGAGWQHYLNSRG